MKTVLTLFLFIPLLAASQIDETPDLNTEALIENEVEVSTDERTEGLLIEDLSRLMRQPLDLNSANYTDISSLKILSYEQINNLIQHRLTYGLFRDMEELQQVSGFDSSTVRSISKYANIKHRETWKNANSVDKKHSSTLIVKSSRILEKSEGYKRLNTLNTPHYMGDPNSLFVGFRHRYLDKISLGLLGEKDPGESFLKGAQKNGFDFYSAHISLKINQVVKQVIIGDYQVHFGQGLCFSSSALGGKSSDVLLVEQNSKNLRPNFSVNESIFLRGIASELEFGSVKLIAFYSRRKLDAVISNDQQNVVTSISNTGLHRNENELAKKNTMRSDIGGIDLEVKGRYFHPGLSFVRQELSHSLNPKPGLYNVMGSTNSILLNTAFHYILDVRNLHFFGEIAHATSHGNALITGALFNVDPKIHLTISYRNYGSTYTTSYTSSFSENSNSSNEKGLFSSMVIRFNRSLTWSIYIDFFRFPWLKYQVNAPSWGMDRFSEIKMTFSKKTQLSIRFRLREKQQNSMVAEHVIPPTAMSTKWQLRCQFSYQIHENLRLRSRIEFVTIRNDLRVENGFLTFHELKFKRKKTPVSLLLRLSFFDTDSYSSRIYAYEQDLPGSYSIPAHYGLGSRFVFLATYKASRFLTLYLKFAQSIFENQTQIGSSWDMIEGSVKSEIKLMCKMEF